MHQDYRGGVLPWAPSTPALWQVEGDFAARIPARSCKALQSPQASPWPVQCPGCVLQKRSTSFPTGNLQTELQPKDRQHGDTRRALQG